MSDEHEFTLANAPPQREPAEFDSNENCRQRALLAGLDALPRQLDLFQVDGDREVISPAAANRNRV